VAPGGLLIFSTCSLEHEEGEAQVAGFLDGNPDFERVPVAAAEIGADPAWISGHGDLRTLPSHLPMEPQELSGIDGFYAARLRRKS
jgi:16S rRNA (cytosine967-C5)-methyltransferase